MVLALWWDCGAAALAMLGADAGRAECGQRHRLDLAFAEENG